MRVLPLYTALQQLYSIHPLHDAPLPLSTTPLTETTGALSPTFDRALRALGKHARAPTTHDSIRYGLSRSSPRTFLAHHRAAISAAVVLADATTISLAAPAMSFKLTMGMSPF